MKKFPIDIQYDAMDCGPACLKMIAAYYGKQYLLDGLRKRCNISREGVSLMGISRTAEEIGFSTFGGRFTFDQLAEKAPFPCIVHWKQNHFVVVYRITNKRAKNLIHVADPGKGLI